MSDLGFSPKELSGRGPPMWQLHLGSRATGRETGNPPQKRPRGITPCQLALYLPCFWGCFNTFSLNLYFSSLLPTILTILAMNKSWGFQAKGVPAINVQKPLTVVMNVAGPCSKGKHIAILKLLKQGDWNLAILGFHTLNALLFLGSKVD